MTNHYKIIVPMYNVEKWISNNINSIMEQNYKNFQCILIDDISTDNTVDVVKKLIEGDERFKLFVNQEKKYALKNIYEGIQKSNPKDHNIIVTVDGDDWLYHNRVLDILNYVYDKTGCFLTYGEYVKLNDLKEGRVVPNGSYNNGEFYRMAWDVAFMMPMLEMAAERHVFVPDILYVYNNDNPINDFKVNSGLQLELDRQIRTKPPYKRIGEM